MNVVFQTVFVEVLKTFLLIPFDTMGCYEWLSVLTQYHSLVQESALAVSKVVLAPQFEKATLQEMRALVMEGSSMRIFLRGEVFELRHKKIGMLLEGFVRQENSTEIITAPAGLMLKTPLPSPAGKSVHPPLTNSFEKLIPHLDV